MPSLIFIGFRGQRFLFLKFKKKVIYSKGTALTANSTTPSDSPDFRDSYDHNVIYSKGTALTANSTTPSDSPDSRDSYDHNDYMPSLIFLGVRVIYSKRKALTANSATPSDSPDSRIQIS
ncbi:hypothetical protein Avbf_17600 [Armadillidium vulgare]|nr:hypothetical protein Avbf_17600 [Armadillidium vulgare]